MKVLTSDSPEMVPVLASRNLEERFRLMIAMMNRSRFGTETPSEEDWPAFIRLEQQGQFVNGAQMMHNLVFGHPSLSAIAAERAAGKLTVDEFHRQVGEALLEVGAEMRDQIGQASKHRIEGLKEYLTEGGCNCEACDRNRASMKQMEEAVEAEFHKRKDSGDGKGPLPIMI